jgi:CO/xanthine dehydrogenase Mo-binding subunit|tara:strand:+ start:10441 stop:12861 length:2421 start_codon:yes stop_codon:yes gene_type:complete
VADYKYIGKDYQTPDIVAKVTGQAKYAEDFRAEGMVFAKLLLSPMPHARITRIDASEALAMDGVEGILTEDDMPPLQREGVQERALNSTEPLYEGQPILAIAAVDETTAADAIEKIQIDYEPLPFAVDPMESLRPGSANARLDGNAFTGREVATIKWPEEVWAAAEPGQLPMGEAGEEWEHGDVETALAAADLVLDETSVQATTSHQPLETRTAMAYWQNGKCYLHCSTQSTVRSHAPAANWIGIDPEDLVLIAEYAGGGFGSKIPGSIFEAIPALLSRKIGKPVMMRINRQEENYIGRARPGYQSRVKAGFTSDGRLTALDVYIVQENGPYNRQGDFLTTGRLASLVHQPENIRFRGVSVITNTPPHASQRGPGGVQQVTLIEPIMAKAARQLGIDQVEFRRINSPSGAAEYGPANDEGVRRNVTSANVREALDMGAEIFNWEERRQRSGQRNGTKVTGVGVAVSSYVGGSLGYDGLFVIKPDGKLYVTSGPGNLGTHSVFDTTRAACEVLDFPFENVEVTWGDTSRNLPWSASQGGSQTTHAHTRANWAAGLDAKRKLQEIAARDLGGSADDYDVADGRVFHRSNRSRYLTFARAAERAIQLGGTYDGHELPEDINPFTVTSATNLAGQGLMGIARDNFGRDGDTYTFVVGFAEVEVDVETGHVRIVDYTATADCGVILHPRSLGGQIHGGSVQGFGHALKQKWVFDQHWGLGVAKRFYSNKPPTLLDGPLEMQWGALDTPDPQTPVGSKGIGEPPQGAGAGAIVTAIADAIGDEHMRRTPATPDMILSSLEEGPDGQLTAHLG